MKSIAPEINGRTIDDIVDYLTCTFIPLMLVWKAGWLPDGWEWLVAPALIASLFGFANVAAKQERAGFFLGFPSYWNAVAFYFGLSQALVAGGSWWNAAMMAALTLLTVTPVRFIYPNLAPSPWRGIIIGGAVIWALLLAAMLPAYPRPPEWLALLSLAYPAFYVLISVISDVRSRARTFPTSG